MSDINNQIIPLTGHKGRITLITFFRFAACPFCNLRVRELKNWQDQVSGNVAIVGVFGSPEDKVREVISIHNPGFPLVSDLGGGLYRAFGIGRSRAGVAKGILLRLPTLLRGWILTKRNPLIADGMLSSMPASFLVSDDGTLLDVYYGKDEGDHIPLSRIESLLKVKKY